MESSDGPTEPGSLDLGDGDPNQQIEEMQSSLRREVETHAGGEKAGKICGGLGFDNSFRVDAIGQRGGLWLLWRSGCGVVTIEESSEQFIYARVDDGVERLHLIVVYAARTVSRRSGLWEELSGVIQGISEPLVVGGDFNTILRLDERTGGNGRLSQDSVAFGEWISDASLIDMGFTGHRFTWRRGRTEQYYIAKRLDRVLCNAQARLKWQEASVTHLPFLASDHTPLYVQLSPVQTGDSRRRPFRFEAAWLLHESFKDLLRQSWNDSVSTPNALQGLKDKLKRWNRDVFEDVNKCKEDLMREIKDVQDILEAQQTDDLLSREETLLRELDVVLKQEELIWFQKSRERYIAHGDRNTRYFHTSTVIRRRRNRIKSLKDDGGQWVSSQSELEALAVGYYKRLYSMDDVEQVVEKLPPEGFSGLRSDDITLLERAFVPDDVDGAIQSMGRYKAPGLDGFQPVFYHDCWEIVGRSVQQFALEFFCDSQVSIPGRLSVDNIVVVQEAVHSMRRKKGKKGWMLLKLDLEKTYDRIRWDFLEDTLKAAHFPARWVQWIMRCVTGPSMYLLWNGEKSEPFVPLRGLRHGDPLSPYLFVLCLERLCHLIDTSMVRGEWKPIRLSRGGPQLSHICFADDLILFAEASFSQIKIIRRILERFCEASGQKVSLEKSKIFFSGNVSRDLEKLSQARVGSS
ncbi:unnamed protein product [Microthlaspi erraticum]|uniref:Uncharacterized protein n=1 Tax=Microthlaspi erraticum TaxID=1685480 RepID=A0A6D2L5G0_9BRAS|nr:unnamed protein product [Microthlaspi erraticum]